MPSELEPQFLVTAILDGDDDPATQTSNAEYELRQALATIRANGYLRDFTLEKIAAKRER